MEFRFEQKVNESYTTVIKTLRDGMANIAPFLEGIKSIETVERVEKGNGQAYLLNIWQATQDSAPSVARPFIKEDMLRWKDHADWDEPQMLVKWRLEPFKFGTLFTCSGTNYFLPHPEGGTNLIVSGSLEVYPDKLPGVPGFIARKIRPDIEKFVVNLITPNMKGLADGLNRYFAQGKAKPIA